MRLNRRETPARGLADFWSVPLPGPTGDIAEHDYRIVDVDGSHQSDDPRPLKQEQFYMATGPLSIARGT